MEIGDQMTTKRLIRISYFTLLTIVGGLIKIQAGPVAFTMQTLVVILSGFVLGARDGFFSQFAYMFIGLIGVPIFTQGGGFQYIFQPSFGYIISFCIGSFIAGFVMNKFRTINNWKIWLSGILGLIPVYIIGMSYQVMILVCVNGLSFSAAMLTLVNILIYWAIDIVMIFIVSLLYPRVMSMLKDNSNNNTPAPPSGPTEVMGDIVVDKHE